MQKNSLFNCRILIRDVEKHGLNNERKSHVAVCGILVNLLKSCADKPTVITLDDGTGLVDCVLFGNCSNGSVDMDELCLGECLEIRGRPNLYRGAWQLVVKSVVAVKDPNLETVWINQAIYHKQRGSYKCSKMTK